VRKYLVPEDQIDYMHSVLLRKVTDALTKDLKSLEFEHKPRGPFGIATVPIAVTRTTRTSSSRRQSLVKKIQIASASA